jgi:hypothetical protein
LRGMAAYARGKDGAFIERGPLIVKRNA